MMVALPHGHKRQYSSSVVGAVSGRHCFKLQRGRGEMKMYEYTISEEDVHIVSQTIAAILGETSSDEGDIDEEKFFYLSEGPTLVLDGGYYTMGMVVVSRGGSVDEDMTESSHEFAMANVNEEVVRNVKDKLPKLSHYSIEYLCQEDDGRVKYDNNGKVEWIDLRDIRAEKINVVCDRLIEYLYKRYDMYDIKYILVTGGTGHCFYPRLLKTFCDNGLMDKEHLLLTTGLLNGEPHSIEYAIAIGAYKGLRGIFE